MNNQNKKTQNKRVAKGWEDDEPEMKSKSELSTIHNNHNTNIPSQPVLLNNEIGSSTTQQSSKTSTQQQKSLFSSINLEKQLLDNILAPTGIKIKPSDNQLKEYLIRLKNLNKTQISEDLMTRIVKFYDEDDLKSLQKCLYVIEFSIQNGIIEVKKYFDENSSLFSELKENSEIGNSKVIEIIDNILVLLGKIEKKNTSFIESKKKIIKEKDEKRETKKEEKDESLTGNSKVINENQENSEKHITKENTNSVFDIFGQLEIKENNQNQVSPSSNSNILNQIDFGSQPPIENQKKGFGFVKKTASTNENTNTTNITQTKKDIDFDLIFGVSGTGNSQIPIKNSIENNNQNNNQKIIINDDFFSSLIGK